MSHAWGGFTAHCYSTNSKRIGRYRSRSHVAAVHDVAYLPPAAPILKRTCFASAPRKIASARPTSLPVRTTFCKVRRVYWPDGFSKVIDGTLIGDNLGNAI